MAGALVALLTMSACSGSGDDAAPETTAAKVERTDVLGVIADDVIVPGQEALVGSTRALADSVVTLCNGPATSTADAARQAWTEASTAWAHTAAFRFGPLDSLRSTAQIAYPIDLDKIDAVAAGPTPAEVTAESIDALGADQRGLRAVEQLLFDGDAAAIPQRRCSYAAAAAELVARAAVQLRDAWTVGLDGESPWRDQFAEGTGEFDDVTDSLGSVVNGSLMAIDDVVNMHLEPALGSSSGEPDAAAADPGAAQDAIGRALATIASARAMFTGSPDATPAAASIGDLLDSDEPAETYLGSLDAASTALAAVSVPLARVEATPGAGETALLQTALDELDEARTVLRTQIASQLGVTVTFSESDGDG